MDTARDQAGFDKIDPVTALQDSIDGISIAMFEALRGLRDAVAPDSVIDNANSVPGSNDANDNSSPDTDELWQAYRSGDPDVVKQVKIKITTREDFYRWYAKREMERDTALVKQLATKVLEKRISVILQEP